LNEIVQPQQGRLICPYFLKKRAKVVVSSRKNRFFIDKDVILFALGVNQPNYLLVAFGKYWLPSYTLV
jgi:hypothetical protein